MLQVHCVMMMIQERLDYKAPYCSPAELTLLSGHTFQDHSDKNIIIPWLDVPNIQERSKERKHLPNTLNLKVNSAIMLLQPVSQMSGRHQTMHPTSVSK